ncbi:MAG: hypothetical protein JNL21_27580 [Myxococcales bacterium]|nr:hypothetical protein [Myxococcales bacterium]
MADGGFAMHTIDAAPGGISYRPDHRVTALTQAKKPSRPFSVPDDDLREWELQDAVDLGLGQIGLSDTDRSAVKDLIAMLRAGGAVRALALERMRHAVKTAERVHDFRPSRPTYETWAHARADVWRQVEVYRAVLPHREMFFVLAACRGLLHGLVSGVQKLWVAPPGAVNDLSAMRIRDAVTNESLDRGQVLFRIFRAVGMPKKDAEARARGAEHVKTSRATRRRLAQAKGVLSLRQT